MALTDDPSSSLEVERMLGIARHETTRGLPSRQSHGLGAIELRSGKPPGECCAIRAGGVPSRRCKPDCDHDPDTLRYRTSMRRGAYGVRRHLTARRHRPLYVTPKTRLTVPPRPRSSAMSADNWAGDRCLLIIVGCPSTKTPLPIFPSSYPVQSDAKAKGIVSRLGKEAS